MDKGHDKEKQLKIDNFHDSRKPKLHKRFQPQIYSISSLFSKILKM